MKFKFYRATILMLLLFSFLCIGCKSKCGKSNLTPPESITISIQNEAIIIGEEVVLEASIYPSDADQAVNWSVNQEALKDNIISLNDNIITGLKTGEVTIYATSNVDSNISTSITLPVILPSPEEINVSFKTDTIYIGETLDFEVSIMPSKADQTITYKILDNQTEYDVASISGNTLTGLDAGIAYVTISSSANRRVFKTITINVLHECIDEEDYEAKSIVGAPGEDASTMFNIHYQIKNTKSYALVTEATDVNFENAIPYYGSGYYFEDLSEKLASPFSARNVWHINVDNLKENTDYIYKINNGNDTYSDTYHFKTAGGNSQTSFLFFTDTHYYTGTDGTTASAAVSEELINNAITYNPNISFMLHGGDLIDTGGDNRIWDIYFDCAQSLKKLPLIGVPGNHEYYMNGTAMGDNTYFKAFSAAPKNGPASLKESASWFKHNDTLFILVDNVRTFSYNEQLEWIANLLETQEYEYSIICFHYPVNQNTTDYDENYLKIFDKYSVDLVLDGHYHFEDFRQNYYNGAQTADPYLGTTYLAGSFSGIKSASTPENAINEARGYIIDVTNEGIKIQVIYANGNLGSSWLVTNRRTDKIETATKKELLSSISYELLEDNNQISFIWSSKFYGNVKKIYISETLRNEISDYVVFPSPSYTSLILDQIVSGYDYNFEMKIVFNDDSEEFLTFRINRHTQMNLSSKSTTNSINITFDEIPEDFKYLVKKIVIYVNDEYYGEFNYLKGSNPITTYDIINLNSNTNYKVKVVAATLSGNELFSEEITIQTK